MLVSENILDLFADTTGAVWRDLIENVQPGWETTGLDDDDDDDSFDREVQGGGAARARSLLSVQQALNESWRRLQRTQSRTSAALATLSSTTLAKTSLSTSSTTRRLPFEVTPTLRRKLQDAVNTTGGILEGCDVDWYTSSDLTESTHLWPIWRSTGSSSTGSSSLLDADRVRDICLSQEITQQTLQEQGLCFGCPNDRCLPPYSLVLFARLSVADDNDNNTGLAMDCEQLGQAWGEYFTETIEQDLLDCVADIRTFYQPDESSDMPESCPTGFSPTMVDELYDITGNAEFSSSIFATPYLIDELYENVGGYSQGVSSLVQGAYDTQYENFVEIQVDDSLVNDMILALGSAIITALAIVVHTRSPFLTSVGLLQIVLSFPLSFFVYTFLGGLEFFPFLNFIGIFVVFALGADDIFVAVDKWKNARIKLGTQADTTAVAAKALPDAAGSMFLTTLTTAVAFFGTAICPVVRIVCARKSFKSLLMAASLDCVLTLLVPLLHIPPGAHQVFCHFLWVAHCV